MSEKFFLSKSKLKLGSYLLMYYGLGVKFVREHDARTSPCGKNIESFVPARLSLIRGIPPRFITKHENPSNRSVQDGFILLRGRRRVAVCENEVQIGNLEVLTELDVLFQDLIHGTAQWQKSRHGDREAQTAKKQGSSTAGETIRQLSVVGRGMKRDSEEGTTILDDALKKQSRKVLNTFLIDFFSHMVQFLKRLKEKDDKKIELHEKRLMLNPERAGKVTDRYERADKAAKKQELAANRVD